MAEDTGVWLSKELSNLADKQKAYENRAFLVAMKGFLDLEDYVLF